MPNLTTTLKIDQLTESDMKIAAKHAKKSGGKLKRPDAEWNRFSEINHKNAKNFLDETMKILLEVGFVLMPKMETDGATKAVAQLLFTAVSKDSAKAIKDANEARIKLLDDAKKEKAAREFKKDGGEPEKILQKK